MPRSVSGSLQRATPLRSLETLILCPENLVDMWEDYARRYRLIAKVVSVNQ